MTLDEMEAAHKDYLEWQYEEYGHVEEPKPNLVPIDRKGATMKNGTIPEATKSQLLALKEGICPTCGEPTGCYVFDNVMLFWCLKAQHHKFQETLNWS